ncbi:histone-like nucleoid-structuring protein Lsr2 [Streptomyces sp. NPDC057686]|uniref:Lsr2 family DNA-binding protein n=1 Tax=Streptomyces sp. NPDC057686 TaxID=3346212 RepID=UPI00368B903E
MPARIRAYLRKGFDQGTRPQPTVDTAAIRSWALANGYHAPPRGRIPSAVREAWERQHDELRKRIVPGRHSRSQRARPITGLIMGHGGIRAVARAAQFS